MNVEEAKQKLLKILEDDYDTEGNHVEADGVLCELLESLGHQEIVDLYHKIDKWFA